MNEEELSKWIIKVKVNNNYIIGVNNKLSKNKYYDAIKCSIKGGTLYYKIKCDDNMIRMYYASYFNTMKEDRELKLKRIFNEK